MKKLSVIAAAAAITAATVAPVSAQQNTNDPFVSTQLSLLPALFIVGGAAVVVAVAAASENVDVATGTGTN